MKVLYFSTVNWNWIKQRPHFEAYYMSKNNIKVDYFSITPLFKQTIKKTNSRDGHLKIRDKYVLPLASKIKFIRYLNIIYVKRCLSKRYDTIILTHPLHMLYLPSKSKHNYKLVYECMDNIAYFHNGKQRREVIEQEKKICNIADKIITSSEYLKNRFINEYGIEEHKIKIIKNAIDSSFLEESVQHIKLKHPNIMYIGTISEWIDFDTIERFASENTEYTIYLIGPIDKELKQRVERMTSNITLVGLIPHKEVKNYIFSGDIMTIPFLVNELIRGVDPVKMYEYVALNKPVISTYWNELMVYKNNKLVHFYDDYKSFEKHVYANTKSKETNYNVNVDFIKQNNWQVRIEKYLDLL